jgi:hypothetical protein
MSRAKSFTSILMVLIFIALSGASVWAAPGGQGPAPEPIEEPTVEPIEEPAMDSGNVPEDDEEEDEESTVHPVASALAKFFTSTLRLNYDQIMEYHESGMGFGTITQACWMSSLLEGKVTAGEILAAKQNNDFSSIQMPDGETPKNWGQFKKAVLGTGKAHKNLGAIMSKQPGKGKNKDGGQDRD